MITLKTLPQATEQEVFNQVANHLLTQMEQSSGNGGCWYRSTNSSGKILKCAAGCLIADEEYIERMDNNSDETTWQYLVEEGVFPNTHDDLISNLQFIHDEYEPHEWEEELLLVAERFYLEF